MVEDPRGIRARFADARAELVPQEQTTYECTTDLPVRRAGVFDSSGRRLLWVWTDDRAAAGSLYVSPGSPDERLWQAQRAAKRFVLGLLSELYLDGTPAGAVLDPARFRPEYTLGAVQSAPSPAG